MLFIALKTNNIRENYFKFCGEINNSNSSSQGISAQELIDLVRLEDSYGREGLPYEDSSCENPKEDDCLWLENLSLYENQKLSFSNCKLTILNVKTITELTCLESQKNVMFLTGGIVTGYEVLIVCPGDIVKIEILQKIETVFNKIKENTFVILFENLD
jgi:hypothetical protein